MAPARKTQSEKKARKKQTNNPEEKATKSQQNSARQPKKKKSTTQRSKNNRDKDEAKPSKKDADKKNSTKAKNSQRKYDHDKPNTDEQKANYVRFLNELYDIGVQGLLNQYSTNLKSFVPDGVTRVAFDKNMEKNRYKDVICADNSRIQLTEGDNDYIHANYVVDPVLANKFICTQGPMANTIIDFWKMVIQESCENIVMLCQTAEQGKEKCQQYWPLQANAALEFSGILIRNVDVDSKTDTATIISTLEVSKSGEKEKLIVKHHQWRTWPDRSVPQSVMAPFRLLKTARNSSQPTVVHCSAGVGRTGTVVALEWCLQTILAGKNLNIVRAIQELRAMRMHCVQTDLQMIFICKCLTAFAASRQLIAGDLAAKQDKFDSEYNSLIKDRAQPDNDAGYTPLVPVFGFAAAAAAPVSPVVSPLAAPSPAATSPGQPAMGGFFLPDGGGGGV